MNIDHQQIWRHLFETTNKALRCSALYADAATPGDLQALREEFLSVYASLREASILMLKLGDRQAHERFYKAGNLVERALEMPFQAKQRDINLHEAMRHLAAMAPEVWR